LAEPIAFKCLQSVRRRDAQVPKAAGDVEHLELSLRYGLESPKPVRGLSAKQRLRMLAAERLVLFGGYNAMR
jgi:hypothetical protein